MSVKSTPDGTRTSLTSPTRSGCPEKGQGRPGAPRMAPPGVHPPKVGPQSFSPITAAARVFRSTVEQQLSSPELRRIFSETGTPGWSRNIPQVTAATAEVVRRAIDAECQPEGAKDARNRGVSRRRRALTLVPICFGFFVAIHAKELGFQEIPISSEVPVSSEVSPSDEIPRPEEMPRPSEIPRSSDIPEFRGERQQTSSGIRDQETSHPGRAAPLPYSQRSDSASSAAAVAP